MAAAPALKLICLAATGYNNVDIDTAAERGIPVLNIRGYATAAVAQHVLALMLGFATPGESSMALLVVENGSMRVIFACMIFLLWSSPPARWALLGQAS